MTNTLSLNPGVRQGPATSMRKYFDFVVDGSPLAAGLAPTMGVADLLQGLVPVLVTNWPTGFPEQDFGALACEAVSLLSDGRVPLYVCAECGDLACGGVTAVVESSSLTVVWRDFGYQNNYEPFDASGILDGIGPFTFDRADYNAVLQAFRAQ